MRYSYTQLAYRSDSLVLAVAIAEQKDRTSSSAHPRSSAAAGSKLELASYLYIVPVLVLCVLQYSVP